MSSPARWLLMAGLASLVALPLAAQIIAPAGRTLFNRGLMVRNVLRYDAFAADPAGGDVERWRNVSAVVWGARPHFSVSAVLPLVRVERQPGGTTQGSGDISLLARYDAYRKIVPGGFTRLAPELGVKLPSGGTFGSGSTDLIAGLVGSKVRDRHWWVADLQLTVPGTDDSGAQRGQRWRYDLAYLYRLKRPPTAATLLAVVELNGESVAPSQRHGMELENSGGEVVYLSPGLEWVVRRQLVLEVSLPIAVHANLRGSQPEPRGSIVLGSRWLF